MGTRYGGYAGYQVWIASGCKVWWVPTRYLVGTRSRYAWYQLSMLGMLGMLGMEGIYWVFDGYLMGMSGY